MIRLLTLGGPDARGHADEQLTALLAQPKRFALLVYLALATPRGAHQRDTLLALFWPELDSEHARNALSQAVHFLRRAVGPEAIVAANGDGLTLAAGQVWCDAVAFDDALDANRRMEAIELYRGDLLDGCHVADAPEFERWLSAERSRLADRYTRAVESLALEREVAGDFAAAVSLWRRLAARDPYNSRVALGLIRATAVGGDPAGALRQARIHETLLLHELGTAPSAELRAYVERLRSEPVASPAPVVTVASADRARPELVPDGLTLPARERAAPTPQLRVPRLLPRRPAGVGALILVLLAVTAVTALRSVNGAPAIRSVAVLPFDNMSRDTADPVFADGMHDIHLRQLYDRGIAAETSRNLEGLLSAKAYYRQAIERDSSFALGYAGLSQVYGFLGDYDFAPVRPALDSARLFALRAVALDSTLPEARIALGASLGNAHEFVGAERELRRAIELGPGSARAHYWYSILLVALGRGEEALREARRAKELDPFAPRGLTGMLRYAEWLVTGQRPHLALPVNERRPILKVEPGEPWARAREALEHASEGNCDVARVELGRAERLAGRSRRMMAYAASVHWHCGERARALAIIDHMKRRHDANDHGFRIALVYVEMGQKDSAFAWLPRSKWTMAELSALSADWKLDPLRVDPRYLRLMQDLGIRRQIVEPSAADGRLH